MREIKLKLWNGKEITDVKSIDFDDVGNLYHVNGQLVNPLEVKLLQYTGLKDENRVELYENDIVRQRISKEGITPIIYRYYQVIFSEGAFTKKSLESQHIYSLKFYSNYYEKIGNIYENPELLEAK